MKRYLLLFFLLSLIGHAYSQSPDDIPGYYVTHKNDTVKAQIELPKSFFNKQKVILTEFLNKVEVMDSVKGTIKFKPGDIRSYGFTYNGTNYKFFSPSCSKGFNKFLQAIILGKKTNLYTFQTIDANGYPLGAVYTLEKPDGTCVFFNIVERRLSIYKEKLKEFYKDDLELQQLIDKKFQNKIFIERNIKEMVEAANKQ